MLRSQLKIIASLIITNPRKTLNNTAKKLLCKNFTKNEDGIFSKHGS